AYTEAVDLLRDWEGGVPLDEHGVQVLDRCLRILEQAGSGLFEHLRPEYVPQNVIDGEAVIWYRTLSRQGKEPGGPKVFLPRLQQHIVDQAQELVDLERLLNDDRPLSLQIGEPGLAVQRRHDKDRNAVVLELILDLLKRLDAIHLWHHNVADHQVGAAAL